MRRRRVLAALSFTATALAGCTTGPAKSGPKWGAPETEPGTPTQDDSTTTPTTGPGVGLQAGFEYRTGTATDGFAITVTVRNTVDEPREAVLVVTWSASDDSRTEERRVSLDAGASTTYEMTFPEVGDLSFDWREP
ncbi:hypothetical protein [Halorubellus sp. PRR65]|uniref:hypothetical protein n=1 Tax=Halorubellus sp. PRR65 TaxID=3098148 RepID=UPI002B261559|nr:hypothetical protein [Halorubellus sp. PRR65]